LADVEGQYGLGPIERVDLYENCYAIYEEHFPDTVADEFEKLRIKCPQYTQIRCFAKIDAEHISWLWHQYLPIGKPCELIGDPSVGKSYLCISIIAALSLGKALPFDEVVKRAPIKCLYISAEDGPADTLKPRLTEAGADMEHVFCLDGFDLGSGDELLNLKKPEHRGLLERAIKKLKIGFLVLDPLDAFLGGADANSNSQIRGLLSPLNKILLDTSCTLLAIRHMNKDGQKQAMYRGNASIGFTANSRSSFVVGRVGDEGSEERAMMCIKANLCAMPDHVGFTITGAGFKWSDERPDIELGDLLRPDSTSSDTSDRADTEAWLIDLLSEGPVPSIELFEKAKKELSVSESTLKRAKKNLQGTEHEIESKRLGEEGGERGDGEWCWRLLRGSDPPDSTTDSETEPLKEIQLTKGISPSTASLTVQGDQSPESDPLKGLPF